MPRYNELTAVPDMVQFYIRQSKLILFSPLESERPSLFKGDTQIYHQHTVPHRTNLTVTNLRSKVLFFTGASGSGKTELLRKVSEQIDEVDITNTYLHHDWNDGTLTFDEIVHNFREHVLIDPDNERTEAIEANILDSRFEACLPNSPCRLTRGGHTPVFHHYFTYDSDVLAFATGSPPKRTPGSTTEMTSADHIYTADLIFIFHHIYTTWFKQLITMNDGIGCYTSTTNNPLLYATIGTPNCHNANCDSEWARYWIKRELITTYCYTEFARRMALIFPLLLNTRLSSNEIEKLRLMKLLDEMYWTALKKVMDSLIMTDIEERIVNFKRFKTLGFELATKFDHFFLTDRCILDVLLRVVASGIIDKVFSFKTRPGSNNADLALDSVVGHRLAEIAQVYKLCKICMWVSDFYCPLFNLSIGDEIFLCSMETTPTIAIQNMLLPSRKRPHEVDQIQTKSGQLYKLRKTRKNVFQRNSNHTIQLKQIMGNNPLSEVLSSQREQFDRFIKELVETTDKSLIPNFVKTSYQFYKLDSASFANFDKSVLEESFTWVNEMLSKFPGFISYIRQDTLEGQCFGNDFIKSTRLSGYRSLHQNNVRIGDHSIDFRQFVDKTWCNMLSLG